jgi:hypothetical protein
MNEVGALSFLIFLLFFWVFLHASRYHITATIRQRQRHTGVLSASISPACVFLAHLATFMLYTHIARSLSEASHFGLGIWEFGIYGDTIVFLGVLQRLGILGGK